MKKQKGKYFIRQQRYVCGDYMDIDIFPVFQRKGIRRKKSKPTSDIQAKLNQKRAQKKLVRLAHLNFTEDDISLTLTYDEEPKTAGEAQRLLSNFLKRVKRRMKKLGVELKYISATEQGKKSGRYHHHLIINGALSRDEIESIWGLGYANCKRLRFTETGITGLVHYITKSNILYRRYNASKNLKQPEAITTDGDVKVSELAKMSDVFAEKREVLYFEEMFKGYKVIEADEYKNEVNRENYYSIVLYKYRKINQTPQAAFPQGKY